MMLCGTGTEKDLDRTDYVAEPKFDGMPCVAERTLQDSLRIYGKNGLTYTKTLPEITENLQHIKAYFRIIGELVYINEKGEMIFSGSQKRCQISNSEKVEAYMKAYPLILYTFDIVMLNGENLENLPYSTRRMILQHFIGLQKELYGLKHVRIAPVSTSNREMYEWSKKKGWEGVVLKKLNGTYHKGKETDDYLKVKCRDHTIFILPNNAVLPSRKIQPVL